MNSHGLTLSKAANDLLAGRTTPRDLVEACLHRIDSLEPVIRAWVAVDRDRARAEADRLGELLREGRWLGPLHGIPIGVKDLVDVAGLPTRSGSPLSPVDPVAEDAPVVRRLKAAGAIVLGKTVTTEWACFDPPPTRNPWNPARTPGGSSSGSAAAVATGMCLGAVGSQTGGSIVRPASYCGVAGFKPTHGRVSAEGVTPISRRLDHVGPIARCVGDLWHLFRAMAEDGASLSSTVPDPDSPLRWARVAEFFEAEASPGVSAVYRAAVERLESRFGRIPEATLPSSFEGVHASHGRIMAVDAALVHRDAFARSPERFGPKVTSLLVDGLATRALDYAAAIEHQRRFRLDLDALLGRDRVLIMPSTDTVAPGLDSTGSPRFNSPWSFAGLPEATVPCGLDDHGLPCGLQLVGPAGRDDLVLQAALAVERALPAIGEPVAAAAATTGAER